MCNAWNHRPNCSCGWGGTGHSGRGGGRHSGHRPSSPVFSWIPPISHSYESYVNPNATCPVCGEPVFFYQSPHGGRVFFDELGPPWPKHPCTDNSSIPRRITGEKSLELKKTYQWQVEKWTPLFIKSASKVSAYVFKINGISEGKGVDLYFEITVDIEKIIRNISAKSIAQIKNANSPAPKISVANHKGHIVTLDASTSYSSINNRLIRQPSSHIKTKKSKTKKASSPQPKNNTMALAFAKARKKSDEPDNNT